MKVKLISSETIRFDLTPENELHRQALAMMAEAADKGASITMSIERDADHAGQLSMASFEVVL